MDNQEKINNLLEKLEHLAKKQEVFSKEVAGIKEELIQLKSSAQQVPEKIEPVLQTTLTQGKILSVIFGRVFK